IEGEVLVGGGGVRRRRGERPAKLLAVNRDGELRVAQVGVFRHADYQGVCAAADGRGRDRRGVGHVEAPGDRAHERRGLAGGLPVVGDRVHVEVTVGGGCPTVGVVEEG